MFTRISFEMFFKRISKLKFHLDLNTISAKMILLVFVLNIQFVTAQDNFDIHQWIKSQQEMLQENPEKVYANSQELEKNSKNSKSRFDELVAVDMQCIYFKVKNDFDKMLHTARHLESLAKNHKIVSFEIVAKKHQFEALAFTGLVEDGFKELMIAEPLIDQLDDQNEFHLISKSDLYVAISNYYSLTKDFKKQLKYIQLAGQYFEKIPTEELRERLDYIHKSNLAGVYFQLNQIDSAIFYAEKSLTLEKNYNRRDIQSNNFIILGNTSLQLSNYQKALEYFQQAEIITGYKNHLNTEILLEKIIETYKKLGDEEGVNLYKSKLDSLQLNIAKNQNKSLQSLLKETSGKSENNINPIYAYGLGLVVLGGVIYWIFQKRKRKYKSEESINQLTDDDYTILYDLIQKNDPSFLTIFNQKFKNFNQELLEKTSTLTNSELELCAMMKLKIPTKQIAQYKFLSPKTVQNKKHLIRKKLNIPSDVDLYDWFEKFH